MYLVGIPLFLTKATRAIWAIFAAELIITHELASTPQGLFFGVVVGLVVGMLLAFPLVLLLLWTEFRATIVKSIGYGAVAWFAGLAVVENLLGTATYFRDELLTNIILLVLSIVYSVVTAIAALLLARDR